MASRKKATAKKKAGAKRGKGESMTGAKEAKVAVRNAVDTMQLFLPTKEDYALHRKAIMAALEKKNSANGSYRKALQSAQAAGINTDAMLEAARIVRANDPKKTADELNQLAFALEQEGFAIHITVHDTLAGDQLDTVYRKFFRDGASGKALDNRYPDSSDLYAQAARAWRHGMAHNMKKTPAEADDAVKDEMTEIEKSLPPPPMMTDFPSATTH